MHNKLDADEINKQLIGTSYWIEFVSQLDKQAWPIDLQYFLKELTGGIFERKWLLLDVSKYIAVFSCWS